MDKKRLFRIIVLVPICIILWLVYTMVRNGFDLSREPLPEYNSLFTKDVQSQLQHPFVYKSKIREPESNYILDNDFHLTVYKLDLRTNNMPLNRFLILDNEYSNKGFNAVSNYADDSILEMTRASNKIGPVSTLHFKHQGNLIKVIAQNDSLVCYYLKFKNFSLSYDGDSDKDICGQIKKSDNASISLAFIKKKKSLYVIMLFKTKDENKDFQPDLLFSMIKK
jgi:hypothetical protein